MNMRKTFRLLLASVFCCAVSLQTMAYDYETRHEIAVGVGSSAISQSSGSLSNMTAIPIEAMLSSIFSGGTHAAYTTYENKSKVVPISVEYFYHPSSWFGFGGILAFNSVKQDIVSVDNRNGGGATREVVGDAKKTNFAVMPAVKFDWLRKKHFGMYSKVAAGVTFQSEKQNSNGKKLIDQNKVNFGCQVSALGLEGGWPFVRAFLELGAGEQGYACFGVRAKF